MRRALALIVLLAACSDAPGVRLEIRAGDTGAVQVELYLATRPCASCDGMIAPAGVDAKLAGDVWLLDGNALAGTPNTAAKLDGGRYVYDLRTPDSSHDAAVAYVVVVGLDANQKVVAVGGIPDLAISHDGTDWYRLTLHAATDRPSSDARDPLGDRVYVWRRTDPGLAACVGIEHSDADGSLKRLWLVPEDDTDCDGIEAAECDEYAYKANGTAQIQDASCVTSAYAIPNTTGKTCLLGGHACIDGSPLDASCGRVAPSYCVPDSVCSNASCAPNLPVCIRDSGTVPRIHCDVPYLANTGQPCNPTSGGNGTEINLESLLALPNMPGQYKTACKGLRFTDLQLNMPAVSSQFQVGQVVFVHGPLFTPCAFDFSWVQGSATSLGTTPVPMVKILDVELQNGNHMLMPIEVLFHATSCPVSEIMRCTVGIPRSDGITHCAQE